jgi:hypothetical protein
MAPPTTPMLSVEYLNEFETVFEKPFRSPGGDV